VSGPQLTVAIPTFNGQRHLAEALRSVLAQEHVRFDLVISDDRSEDQTLEVVREIAGDRARVLVNSERLGLAANWNQCVVLGQTPLVAVFHQDDLMRPEHLAAHAAFATDDRVGLICSAADVIDDDGNPVPESVVGRGDLGPADRVFGAGEVLPELAAGNSLRCSAVTMRAMAHADVGGFDPAYRYAVDWDFWIRVGRRWGVRWLARPTVAVRWHVASETHRFKSGTTDLEESARVVDSLFVHEGARWPDAPRLRREADRRLARAFLNRSYEALKAGDPALARSCLRRAVSISPRILTRLALDPRLAIQLGVTVVAPRAAGRWLAHRGSGRVHESSVGG
jgi:glycosyltransferase involved in cell wall biosynthesis